MITVFTPTYNRVKLLPRLYASLCSQTNKNFEWLVVDDCSTDGTEQYIKSLKQDGFSIRYFKNATNSGKYIAYNLAIEKAQGEYFICLDSDDYFTPEAVETMSASLANRFEIGTVFPQRMEGINNSGWAKADNKKLDIIDTEELYGIRETTILIRTDILKKHRFPKLESNGQNEKFCAESVLYNDLIDDGQFYAVNKAFYCSEYQSDGLTNNIRKLWLKNPSAFILDLQIKYKVYAKYGFVRRLVCRAECILELNAFCKKSGLAIFPRTPSKFLSTLLYLPGCLFALIRYKGI